MAEVTQTTYDRLADLEDSVRRINESLEEAARQKWDRPIQQRWFRTMGETVPGTGYVYPAKPAYRIPGVFLDGTPPAEGDSPYEWTWTPRSAVPQLEVLSPGGWLPIGLQCRVAETQFATNDTRWTVVYAPPVRIEFFNALPKDANNEWEVYVWLRHGPDFQTMKVKQDWVQGTPSNGLRGWATLDVDRQSWQITQLGC